MNCRTSRRTSSLFANSCIVIAAVALPLGLGVDAQTATPGFGPANPFYAASTLPFQAPPFNKIKDADYEPAMNAGIAQNMREFQTIANNTAPPTFDNTLVALERSGQLLERVNQVFGAMLAANTDPTLDKVQDIEAPKLAALSDGEYLNPKLFARVKAIYDKRDSLNLDPDGKRLVERTYDNFVHAGANLSDADRHAFHRFHAKAARRGQRRRVFHHR
jgi:peptidyl-dipeptidase Dcp